MGVLRGLGGGLLGVVLAGLVHPLLPHDSPPVPEAPPPVLRIDHEVIELPADCSRRKNRLEAQRDALQSELKLLTLRTALLEGVRIDREGREQPWPDTVHPLQDPDTLRAHVLAAMEAADFGQLVELDCDEFPCIVAIVSGEPPAIEGGASASTFDRFYEAMNEQGYEDYELAGATTGITGGTDGQVFALRAPDGHKVDGRRTAFRIKQAFARLSEEEAER